MFKANQLLSNKPFLVLSCIGVIITAVAWGPCLAPWNTACFTNGEWGDYKFHYQGWINYLHGQTWIPPYIHAFTWPYQSSVMFTDSIPAAAIIFKPITVAFGFKNWQYFGILSLLNSFVISWSASSVGRYRQWPSQVVICLGILLLTSSLSWSRLIVGHEALQLHGIVILGLAWVIVRQRNLAAWLILVCLSIGIHAYYTPMLLACFCTYLFGTNYRTIKLLLLSISVGCSLFIFGFLPNSLDSGSAVWGANMLSLIDPQGHSSIFTGLKKSEPFEIEGYSYLGFGVLIGLLIQISRHEPDSSSKSPLFPVCWWIIAISYYVFALGHTWNIGDTPITPYKVFYAVPGLPKLYDVFRSAGRFTWLIVYSIMFWLFECVSRSGKKNLILGIIVALQLLDSNLRTIVRQGGLYKGLLRNGSNPVQKWADLNPAIAENIREANLFIVGSVRDTSILPPPYTPQYLNPSSFSNWGGEGITRLPLITKDQSSLQHWIARMSPTPSSKQSPLPFNQVLHPTIIVTDNESELQQIQTITKQLNKRLTPIGNHYYLFN